MEESSISEWSEIRSIFGNSITEYLIEHNCVVYKSKTGAFIMTEKDRDLFDDCAHLMKNCKRTRKTDPRKQCSEDLSEILYVDTDIKDNLYLFENYRRNTDFEAINESLMLELSQASATQNPSTSRQNIETNNALDHLDGTICLKHRRINAVKSEIFTHLYRIVKDKHKECIPKFKAIVQSFIHNHRAFKYNILLNSFPQDETLVDGLLSKKQVIEFFYKIISSVVPVSLFGNHTNLKKIKKALFFFLKSANGETLSIQYVVKQLNKNNVVWLRKIKSQEDQWVVLYHIVQWFFEKFISSIVRTYLYTEKGVDRQKYFFRRWKKVFDNKFYIKQQVEKKAFLRVKLSAVKNNDIPIAKLKFYAKKDGLRPILSTKATPAQISERQVIKRLLRQLYLKNHETTSLKDIHQVWNDLKKSGTSSEKAPIYFVSCDILDAYGSIIHDKLLKIINDELDKLPSKLAARWFVVLNPNDSPIIEEYVDAIAPEILPIILPRQCLCCLDTKVDQLCKVISVDIIRERLTAYIVKQPLRAFGKYYILKQGVGQGLPMSALLCDLYYEDMLKKELSDFKQEGHFFRYVDDFLYITKSEDAARRFLDKVNEGIKSYNCTFKQQKTQTNLMPYNNEEFVYIGYCFNIKTFHVIPKYSSTPARYASAVSRPFDNTTNTFIQRISHFKDLKLCPMIMDLSINSEEVILNIIKNASIFKAERCSAFITNMYDLKDTNYYEIFNIVKARCIQLLISEFLYLMSIHTEIDKSLKKKVKKLVWSSFYEVFRRKKFIKKWFLRILKEKCIDS